MRIKSIILEEYPVSLSYQPIIFIILPITEVISESRTQECVFPTISIDTMGSCVNSRMPFRGPLAAFSNKVFTSCIEVFFLTFRVISHKEPLATGTRMPHPPITLFKSGKSLVSAFAAPVVL